MRGSQVSPSSGQTRAGVNLSGTSIKNANSDRMATPPDAVVQVPLDPLKNAMESRATPGQTTPPLGSSIKPATPALVAQAPADDSVQSTAPGSSQVESYDEETYQCKANDSFRNISLAYYHTDKYERALQLFNRNHPLAADALKQDAVTLQSGLNVYIPPKRILDKYYVDMVGAVPAVGSTTTPPVPQKSASASAPAAPSADERERTYRVKDGGEMFRDIARTTLGDPERWAEIYRLNPRFDPAEPIPASTELRVPNPARADARPTP